MERKKEIPKPAICPGDTLFIVPTHTYKPPTEEARRMVEALTYRTEGPPLNPPHMITVRRVPLSLKQSPEMIRFTIETTAGTEESLDSLEIYKEYVAPKEVLPSDFPQGIKKGEMFFNVVPEQPCEDYRLT